MSSFLIKSSQGQAFHMKIFYLTSAFVEKLARHLLSKYIRQRINCYFASIYSNLNQQNKLVKENCQGKLARVNAA